MPLVEKAEGMKRWVMVSNEGVKSVEEDVVGWSFFASGTSPAADSF